MGTNNVVFLEVIEHFDETGQEIVHRIPEEGSGEIKYGAQLIVRESQTAVFFYNGKACDAFGSGRHTLTTANIPILTKLLSLPWGFTSPLRAEIYFVNMIEFPSIKWGTRDPVAFKDSELGLVRLRAFGVYSLRVVQPIQFINSLAGTRGIYTAEGIEEYLSQVIVARFNDYMGETLDSLFKLPQQYDELADGLKLRLQEDFSRYGLELSRLYLNSITPPTEVQKAIDDKSRLSLFDNLDRLMQMKAAMAVEKISENQGEAGAGLGMGLGFMMPGAIADQLKRTGPVPSQSICPHCREFNPEDSKFCSHCGRQISNLIHCAKCGRDLPPQAKFCPGCGAGVGEPAHFGKCSHCGAQTLSESGFCSQCGERIAQR
ncbi:MAG: SPFH domain-containing protein [Syntrophobacteraceae bacterium]